MEQTTSKGDKTTIRVHSKKASGITDHTKAVMLYWLAVVFAALPALISGLRPIWWIFAELAVGSIIVAMVFNRRDDNDTFASKLPKVSIFLKIVIATLFLMIIVGIAVVGIINM